MHGAGVTNVLDVVCFLLCQYDFGTILYKELEHALSDTAGVRPSVKTCSQPKTGQPEFRRIIKISRIARQSGVQAGTLHINIKFDLDILFCQFVSLRPSELRL